MSKCWSSEGKISGYKSRKEAVCNLIQKVEKSDFNAQINQESRRVHIIIIINE